jgi:mono/diheme cytochrome c family protein
MRARNAVLIFVVVLAAVALGLFAFSWRPAMEPVEAAARAAFDPSLVKRGSELAAIGNCKSCHTRPDGEPYAGGVRLQTPFGTIYGTNITPEPDTGIGRWSEAAFRRAMHEGVSADGRHLYPAFPYDHFTKASDQDVRAIYAFLQTVKPVRASNPPNELPFPLNVRPLLAGWKLLYFKPARFEPDPARSEDINKGAYLAEGLAHCGSCHTPRNSLGAEEKQRPLDGGQASGWWAPALNGNSPSPVPWSADQIHTYLRTGFVESHGVAAGPMREVVVNLGSAPDSDVRAIASYIATSLAAAVPRQKETAAEVAAAIDKQRPVLWQTPVQSADASSAHPDLGAAIYAGACAMCHERTGLRFSARGIHLASSKVVHLPDASNLAHIILHGVEAPPRARFAAMPGFADALTDTQIAAVAAWLRRTSTDRTPWPDLESTVNRVRTGRAE